MAVKWRPTPRSSINHIMNEKALGRIWLGLAMILGAVTSGHRAFSAEALESAAPKPSYEEPTHLTGTICARGNNQPLFKFERVARRSGSTLKVRRDFNYTDGKPAARERAVYEGDDLVSYELEDLQTGARGSATVRRDTNHPQKNRIDFEYAVKSGDRPKTRTEALHEDTLIGDMVGPFLVSHWDALSRGEKVRCRYIVVPRSETVGFTFVKDSESTRQGRGVLVIKMEATSRLIAALVNPLFFTLERDAPHRVVQYLGRTTPKLHVGGKWKDLDAVTVFDWGSAN
jgi:hypothetical protein